MNIPQCYLSMVEEFIGEMRMSINKELLDKIIETAKKNIELSCREGQRFNYCTYSGTYYIGQYYLLANWLGNLHPDFDRDFYRKLLLNSQLSDGSWYQVKDANLSSGELNTTFINYWVLKVLGENVNSPKMEQARQFVLVQGGMEKVNLFTKTLLCLFGEVSWQEIPPIPYILFIKNALIDYRSFAQWIGPHILPFSYLKRLGVKKDMGPLYSIKELSLKSETWSHEISKKPLPFIDDFIVEKILAEQSSVGSLGGYTHSTLFALTVLEHFSQHSNKFHGKIQAFKKLAETYLWEMYLNPQGSPYAGSTCDGHYWDSIFCAQALVEADGNQEIIKNVASYIAQVQTAEGGVPFGRGFEKAPDVDDTVEAMLLWKATGEHTHESKLAQEWLIKRQNTDGGWGAFGHNNNEKLILKLHSKKFLDTAELFDYSSADCTGNILEALSYMGLNQNNSITIKNGVKYLLQTQHKSGAWLGRWGINYLFGTYVATVGLLKAGKKPEDPQLKKAIHWMISKQNPDGGFGESTLSYLNENWMGKGISTHTQTAWVLIALIDAGMSSSPVVEKGIEFLLKDFSLHQKFEDASVIGTGHPRNVYLQYPSYAACFPLLALCRYRKSLEA
jgi:squalene-hopene/tetraprenyl-beta-curcumene cyclase